MEKFELECLVCNEKVANSNNVLGRHIRKEHKIEWPDYIVKYYHDDIWPICKCGCKERMMWKKGGFRKFIKGHDNRGKNNSMFGKKGKDNPNFGKVRTEEHKKKYSEAAKKRWSDSEDPRRKLMQTQ